MKKVMLDLTQVKEGMVLAKDMFSNDGTLLVPGHTTLTPNHIIKMKIYNIHGVTVYVDEAFKGAVVEDPVEKIRREIRLMDTQQEKDQSITSTKAFKDFSVKYDEQVEKVEDQLDTIVHTGNVEAKPLYDLVSEILTSTATTANLFSYMCRMQQSDNITYSHSLNVSVLASILGKWLNLPLHTTTELAIAGLLHDIGKVRVNQDILNKAGKLTAEEFEHIKQHTTLGYEIIANSKMSLGIKHAILMHHEKMNGAGYPLGLSLTRIHDYAKIISIVDIYDAMTALRPYHKRYHPFQVIRMFEEESYGLLEPKYLAVFLERIAHNFMDDEIQLTDGAKGKIIFIHHREPSRPIVQLSDGKILDLVQFPELDIRDFL